MAEGRLWSERLGRKQFQHDGAGKPATNRKKERFPILGALHASMAKECMH